MLSLKRFSQEIKKNMLGISNTGNLIQGIVIKILKGLEKQKWEGDGKEKKGRTPGHPELLVSLAGTTASLGRLLQWDLSQLKWCLLGPGWDCWNRAASARVVEVQTHLTAAAILPVRVPEQEASRQSNTSLLTRCSKWSVGFYVWLP